MKPERWVVFLVCMAALAVAPAVHAAPPGDAAAGKTLYTQWCAGCHGADGRGGTMGRLLPVTPRNLTDTAYMQTRSAAQLFTTVQGGSAAAGLSAAMPGFSDRLTEQQLWDTVAYVQTLALTPAATAPSVPDDLRLTRVVLSLWPEYDDPRVLLVIRGEVEASTTFPARLRLPVPHGAELVGAGIISPQDALLLQPRRIIPGTSEDTLELTISAGRFFVELYYDPLVRQGAKTEFHYAFVAPYPIETLDFDVLQPYTATDFVTEPAAMQQDVDQQGGRHARLTFSSIARGARHPLTVRYQKTSPEPSVAKQHPASSDVSPSSTPLNVTVFAFGLLAVVAILYTGGALFWMRRQRRQEHPSPAGPQAHNAPPSPVNFCSRCGRRLQPAFVFCPDCGQTVSRC